MDVMLYVPNSAKGKAPVFAGLSFNGNHAVSTEKDVPINDRWMRPNTKNDKAVKDNKAAEESRRGVEPLAVEGDDHRTRIRRKTKRFYGDIEPDHADGWKDGLRAALSKDGASTVWKDGDWGAIGAWSWGLSRILDYLETDKDVDAEKKAAVIGHSRLGKTSL